jgi:hypothetical protein
MTKNLLSTLSVAMLATFAFGTAAVHAAPPAPVQPAVAWAFCGVHPDDPNAAAAVAVLAGAHVDATFGPCMPPDRATYTTAEPGARYVDPATYARLVDLNASVGMDTVVYDDRLWSENPGTRLTAYQFWMLNDRLDHVAAWDMGDEFDPKYGDWAILVGRWAIMVEKVEPVTTVGPFTNHLPDAAVIERALADLGHDALSFDCYDVKQAIELTRTFAPLTDDLMVAVSALDYGAGTPSVESIVGMMTALRAEGADRFLIFGGSFPYLSDLTPDPTFGGRSLVDNLGHATPLALAVLDGATL